MGKKQLSSVTLLILLFEAIAGSAGSPCHTLPAPIGELDEDTDSDCWIVSCESGLVYMYDIVYRQPATGGTTTLIVSSRDSLNGRFNQQVKYWDSDGTDFKGAPRIFQGLQFKVTLRGTASLKYECKAPLSAVPPCYDVPSSSGTLDYPDGPQEYGLYENICWFFSGCPNGVHFKWTHFRLSIKSGVDTLTIRTASSVRTDPYDFQWGGGITGLVPPPSSSHGPLALIHFESSGRNPDQGFTLEYECVQQFKPVPSYTMSSSLWGSCRLVDVSQHFAAQYKLLTSVEKKFEARNVPLECMEETCNVVVLLFECSPCKTKKGGLREELLSKGFTRTRCGPSFQCTETQNTRHPLIAYVKTLNIHETVNIEVAQDGVEYVMFGVSNENEGVDCSQSSDMYTCMSLGLGSTNLKSFCTWDEAEKACIPNKCIPRGPSVGNAQCTVCPSSSLL